MGGAIIDMRAIKYVLFPRFPTVAFTAEHLTVFCICSAVCMPWFYMVGFHLFYLEMVVADGTDTFLAFVSCTYHSAIESTDI